MKTKTIKAFILCLLLPGLWRGAFAQISGKLLDEEGKPVGYATVLLVKPTDSTVVRSALSSDSGTFRLATIEAGRYQLKVSSMGYQNWMSDVFEIVAKNEEKHLGSITVKTNKRTLGEVVVRSTRPLFEQRADGTEVNVENSVMSKGSSALEVLERSPGVVIDHQNNSIAMNGKTGVAIMLNGKLMQMSEDQLLTLLNSMSANDLAKIELLTTPGAGYDAEGSAGVINIVTKKNRKPGTNGSISVTAGYGYGEKAGTSLSLNHNSGNTNFYGSYNYARDKVYSDFHAIGSEQEPLLGGFAQSDVLSVSHDLKNNHHLTLGFDTKKASTTLGGSIDYSNSHDNISTSNKGLYNIGQDSVYNLNAVINGVNKIRNTSAGFYLQRQLNARKKLNFNLDYINYKNDYPTTVASSFLNSQGKQAGTNDTLFAPSVKGVSGTLINVGAAKIDYADQINTNVKLETGIKGAYTRTSGSSAIESLVNGNYLSGSSATNNIVMREGIGAAYTTLTAKTDSQINLVAGLRYEYSVTRMNNPITGELIANRELGELFPNLLLTRKIKTNSEWFLSYSQRISRPSYSDLASYVTYGGPNSVNTGNPSLKPTLTYNLKTGYNYKEFSFSILWSRDVDPIARYQFVYSPDKLQANVAPRNLDWQNYLTFQAAIPVNIGNWGNMNYNFTGGWRNFREDYTLNPVQHGYFAYTFNGSQVYKISPLLSLELSGYYNSLAYNGTRRQDGYGVLNIGLKQSLKNNGGTIQLAVSDLLKSGAESGYFGKLTQEAFDLNSHVVYHPESGKYRVFKITYTKAFGGNPANRKNNNQAEEEKKRIND